MEERSPVPASPVPKINIEAVTSPLLQLPGKGRLQDVVKSRSRSSSLNERRNDRLRVDDYSNKDQNETLSSQSSGSE